LSSAALSADGSSAESNPLTPLVTIWCWTLAHPRDPIVWTRSRRSTSMHPTFPSPRCLPPEGAARALFRGPARCCCRRWPAMAAAARVHRRSKTSTRPLPVRCRERLPGRVRSSGFCKWTFPRARLWTSRTSRTTGEWPGRLPCSIESRLSIGQPPKVLRVRGREHRASTFPTVIAHGGDFAPTPIASGTSCRGYRALPCPE
jgi:hypothetical protein